MPHQNVQSSNATAQNAATDPVQSNDQAREQNASAHPEPRSYAAPNVEDSSLAPPAAGEMADYMDEGDARAADDVQQSADHANRPYRTEKLDQQGPKTQAANREIIKGGGGTAR